MPTDLDALAHAFAEFAAETTERAPLYRALCERAAVESDVLRFMMAAPPAQRRPVLFLAAVHWMLLRGHHDHPLAAHYQSISGQPFSRAATGEAGDALVDFVRTHDDALCAVVASRSTQTNEVGRCSAFLPVAARLADEVGALCHLDVGTSAGLNLLLPRFSYEYTTADGATTTIAGDPRVVLPCSVSGPVPLPLQVPTVARSIGLDPSPIDAADPDAAAWLEACVWPDQPDRFSRLAGALALAADIPPDVRRGDAVTSTADLARELAPSGHPVITTSWVLSYLTESEQRDFVAVLDEVARDIDLSWICAEAPAHTPGIPVPGRPDEEITVLSVVRWRAGVRRVDRLATVHPHGSSMRAEPGAPW